MEPHRTTLLGTLATVLMALSPCSAVAQGVANEDPVQTEPFAYSSAEPTLFYQVVIEADYGTQSRKMKYEGILIYRIAEESPDRLSIQCECIWKSGASYQIPRDSMFFKLASQFRSGPIAALEMDSKGKMLKSSRSCFVLGLPIDLGQIAFPRLSDQDTWESAEPVTLVASQNVYGQVQLLPISPEYQTPFHLQQTRSQEDSTTEKVAMLKLQRTWKKRGEPQVSFDETYTMHGDTLNPEIQISGSRNVVLSADRGSLDSMQLSLQVLWKEPNRQLTVPYSIELKRLSEQGIRQYQERKKEAVAKKQAQMAAYQKVVDAIPEVSARDEVLQMIKTGDQKSFDLMVSKLHSEEVKDDYELGRAIYGQFLLRERMPYHAVEVIKRLAPELEKTAVIAKKYATSYSSFDLSLTGDTIAPSMQLTRKQLVCFPSHSRFKPAHFYGAVEDVLVLETRDRTPELIAIKRDLCRLPSPDFIDPNVETEVD
ncbi:hypothetical protein K227x_11860 [Rubripirellula lacrimiformis]|uniref:SLA1 homology domain-containing protein n=1 Tax=Rubripirellula lacrimiformis TaxID=1930273 RepID=A0A517N738_9BACT|nr:hypothetical protein [Rubripirellula lacrimiformis]QDT02808.1 hypothetical protein K227x_11860 [Rubripirellula lacrimiformis]